MGVYQGVSLDARLGLTAPNFAVDGRLGEAIALFERTLTDCERILGVDHPNTLPQQPRRRQGQTGLLSPSAAAWLGLFRRLIDVRSW